MRLGLCLLLLLALVQVALARPPRSQVAVIQDSDGYCNGRFGPGVDFKVKRRLPSGEIVKVEAWPDAYERDQLKQPFYREKLRKRCKEPDKIFEWRWAITLERNPNEVPGLVGTGCGGRIYIHSSRLKVVREDAVGWGWIIDPDGFLNVRARPDSTAEIVSTVNLAACFIVLDQPAYDKFDFLAAAIHQKAAPWTRIMTRDGIVGWVRTTRISLYSSRFFNWDGPIPGVL